MFRLFLKCGCQLQMGIRRLAETSLGLNETPVMKHFAKIVNE